MNRLAVGTDFLDMSMPMHLLIGMDGKVLRTGPTFEQVAPGATGRDIGDVLRVLQPRLGRDPRRLLEHAGNRMILQLRDESGIARREQRTRMRGVAYDLGDGILLVNVFFGADVARAVTRHDLNAGDFAAFDPTVEVLFLMEARAVVMGELHRLNHRLTEANKQAESQAVTDKLTGLHNRRAMDNHLASLSESRAVFGLMHLDLDYFKSVNDTLGHAAGDHVLSVVGRILREQVRSGDMVARVGGDEFTLVFADCADVDLMRRIADRIIKRLEEPIDWHGQTCRISGSIGITMSGFYDKLEPDRLMSDADAALYASKNGGRSQHCVAEGRLAKHALPGADAAGVR